MNFKRRNMRERKEQQRQHEKKKLDWKKAKLALDHGHQEQQDIIEIFFLAPKKKFFSRCMRLLFSEHDLKRSG